MEASINEALELLGGINVALVGIMVTGIFRLGLAFVAYVTREVK